MVVWHGFGANGFDIFGARVTTAGIVLDPEGFVISNAQEDQTTSSIAFDGTNYLVVWFDERGKGLNFDEGSVRGVRVSTNATVLDDPDIEIADRVRRPFPVAAFDGTD